MDAQIRAGTGSYVALRQPGTAPLHGAEGVGILGRTKQGGQKDDPATQKPSAVVIGLWREILLEEPETCPWKFACAMAKGRYISGSDVWQVAEWADSIRENVRRLRLKQIVRDIQDIAKQLS
jgi:hypothetical protein